MGKPRWKKEIEKPDPRTNEVVLASQSWWDRHYRTTPTEPQTELEALMMAAPGDTPNWPPTNHDRDPYTELEHYFNCELDLDPIERQVLDARVIAGLTYRETADLLGTSPTTVWRIYHGAIERIQKRLNEPFPIETPLAEASRIVTEHQDAAPSQEPA